MCVSVREHISETTRPNFTKFTMAEARAFFGGVVIRCLLPVVWMTSCFPKHNGYHGSVTLRQQPCCNVSTT